MRFNPKEIQSEISPPRREGGTGKERWGGARKFFSPLRTDLKKLYKKSKYYWGYKPKYCIGRGGERREVG